MFGDMISDRNNESPTSEGNRKEPQSVRVLPSWMKSSGSKADMGKGTETSEKVSEKSSKVQGKGTSTTIHTNLQCKTQASQECRAEAVDEASANGKVIGNDDACQRDNASKTNNKTQKSFKDHTEASDMGLAHVDPESIHSIAVASTGNVQRVPLSEESSKKNDSSSKEESVNKAAVDSGEGEVLTENRARLPREPCTYGAKCYSIHDRVNQNCSMQYSLPSYRKNETHLDTRSHPGDDDFVDNRPECKYGTSCYRKNVLHNQQYKHTRRISRKRMKPESQANDGQNYEDSEPEESDISAFDSDSYEPSDSEELQLSSELEDDDDDCNNDEKEKKRRRRK